MIGFYELIILVSILKVIFVGFHQVPDFLNARINGLPVKEVIKDIKWLEQESTEKVQKVQEFRDNHCTALSINC